MIERSMVKSYLHYVVPATIAFTLTCIYSIVDGIFVGNIVGDAGLAGINVAYPLYALVLATGTGIGMGGAVISSIREGSGNREGARHATGHTILMLLIFSIPVTLLLLFFARPLCAVLGGAGETLNQAVLYLSVLSLAAPLQVMIVGCLPLIRNRGHVKYAMVASVVSGVINVIFDYVFVVALNWGTMGAGAATALAQCCSFLLIAAFFLRKNERLGLRHFKPNTELFAHSLKLGLAPFGLTLLPEITVVTLNVNALIYGGETAVAAYAVISYVAYVIQMLIQGVADGSQPLVSQCYGAGKLKLVQKIRNTNFVVAISIGLIGLGVMTTLRYQIPSWFGASEAATEIVAFALPVIAFAYMFFGLTHVSTSYFYATDDARGSSLLVYGEAALVVLYTCGLGFVYGLTGVWGAIGMTQITLAFVAAVLLRRHSHKRLGLTSVHKGHKAAAHRHIAAAGR